MLLISVGLGLIIGYFFREIRETLRRIEKAIKRLMERQPEEQKKNMSFGEPMSMQDLEEMEDEARINALNP